MHFRNPKVHHHTQKKTAISPTVTQMNLIQIFTLYILKVHFNIIVPTNAYVSQARLYF